MPYTPELKELIKKVEATRAERVERKKNGEEVPFLDLDQRKERLEFHPDFKDEGRRELQIGPSKGYAIAHEIADVLEATSRVDPDKVDLENPAYETDVLVIGGGPFTGAPTLASIAAHRCGIDLVYVAVPGAVAHVVSGYSMDLIVHPVGDHTTDRLAPAHLEAVLHWKDRADAVVLGPGLGDYPGSLELASMVYRRLTAANMPVVVDADALKAFTGEVEVPRNPRAVLTPHADEFAVLSGEAMPTELDDRVKAVRSLADQLGCVILSKGPIDVISDGKRTKLNDSGNAAMATGGTGDILSGVVGAFLAKGMDTFDAARAAAFVAGAAGDHGMEELGHSMMASDLLWNLPNVFLENLPWWNTR